MLINEEILFPSASTIKLVILSALMNAVSKGQMKLEQTITLLDAHKCGGDGILKELKENHKFTLYEIAKLMIILSDNTAANILIDLLSMEKINEMAEIRNFINIFGDNYMKITDIKIKHISVPLRTPFKTALRTVNSVEDIIVEIYTDAGNIGFGEAPPTGVITGDTTGAIIGAIEDHIKKSIIGMSVENFEELMLKLNNCIVKNTSAKAAVDIALYDLYGQLYNAPLYKLLGGYRKEIITDITISVNEPEEMAKDSLDAIKRGYTILKIKVGKDSAKDMERMKAIRKAAGYDVKLRIDANQGWKPKETVRILDQMYNEGLQIEFVEQPVAAHDIDGLKFVTDNVSIPVLADESIFSPMDALNILQRRAADLINIKLMKTGGIYNALKICSLAEMYGVECMIGCMLEAKVSVTAAVHLACAKSIITKIDLDGPVLCSEDPIVGGAVFNEYKINLSEDSGLGIKSIAY